MLFHLRAFFLALCLSAAPAILAAQNTEVAFGGLKHDARQPVEVSADQLQINQADGSAVFSGNVVIGQGEMRLSAGRVVVIYAAPSGSATGQISLMRASGGVMLVNGAEAAEAREAVYSIDEASIVMTGNVILTQGQNALTSERMVINLNTGTASLEGRVKTIFQAGGN